MTEETMVEAAEFYEKSPTGQYDKEAALALRAGSVMMRRGWFAVPRYAGRSGVFWQVRLHELDHEIEEQDFLDPFTALVEADKWHKENVEKPNENA